MQPTKSSLIAYVTEYHRLRKLIKSLSLDCNSVFTDFEHIAWQLRTAYHIQDNGQLAFQHIGAMDRWGALHDTCDLLALKYNRMVNEVEDTRNAYIQLQIEHQCEAFDHRNYLANQLPIPMHRKQWYIWE